MTSHVIASFDSHRRIYNQRNYVQTTYSTNQFYRPCLTPLPIPSIDLCEHLLYQDRGSTASSSSFMNSTIEHYDNPLTHTYDNPMEYRESYTIKQSLINIPDAAENHYDNTKGVEIKDQEKSAKKSSVLFCFENKRLAFSACLTSFALLFIIAIGIFLLNKFIRPVVIHTSVNHHYDVLNTTETPLIFVVRTTTTNVAVGHLPFPCPSDRWGPGCQNICKPCGLGVCHSITGKCICPADIYGEFCDLWKVNDKPKRGDLTR